MNRVCATAQSRERILKPGFWCAVFFGDKREIVPDLVLVTGDGHFQSASHQRPALLNQSALGACITLRRQRHDLDRRDIALCPQQSWWMTWPPMKLVGCVKYVVFTVCLSLRTPPT